LRESATGLVVVAAGNLAEEVLYTRQGEGLAEGKMLA